MTPSLSKTSAAPLAAQASLSTSLSAKARAHGFKLRLLGPQAQPEPETATKTRICLAALPLAEGWAAQLLTGLQAETELSVSSITDNPPLPGLLRWLGKVVWVRELLTALVYGWLLWRRARRCDILHVFATPHHSQWLRVAPALLLGKWRGQHTVLSYCGMARRWPAPPLLLRWAEVIVAPSAQLIELFAQCGLPARVLSHPLDWCSAPDPLFPTSYQPTPKASASATPRAQDTASAVATSTLEEAALAAAEARFSGAIAEHFAWPKVREEWLKLYGELTGLPKEMQYWKHAWDEGDGY